MAGAVRTDILRKRAGTKLAFVTRGIFLAGLGAGVAEELLFRGLGVMFSFIALETRAFLLTGGEFGIESSVVAIIGYIAVSLAAVWMIRRHSRQ